MKLEFWLVAGDDRAEVPEFFINEDQADERLRALMREFWNVASEFNGHIGTIPESWMVAQICLAGMHTDGSWVWYGKSKHEIEVEVRHGYMEQVQAMAG